MGPGRAVSDSFRSQGCHALQLAPQRHEQASQVSPQPTSLWGRPLGAANDHFLHPPRVLLAPHFLEQTFSAYYSPECFTPI